MLNVSHDWHIRSLPHYSLATLRPQILVNGDPQLTGIEALVISYLRPQIKVHY